jgi:Spy/CpxP family protein refolding chaperone
MKNGIESLGRVRLQGIALLVVALGVGVLGGMALERARSSLGAPPGPPPSGPQQAGLPPDLAQLDLTADQQAQIQAIFDRARPVTDSILALMLPRLRMAEDSTRAQIRAVLTTEQQQRYDELRQREPRRGMGPGEGRPGPSTRPPGSGHGPPPGPPER